MRNLLSPFQEQKPNRRTRGERRDLLNSKQFAFLRPFTIKNDSKERAGCQRKPCLIKGAESAADKGFSRIINLSALGVLYGRLYFGRFGSGFFCMLFLLDDDITDLFL